MHAGYSGRETWLIRGDPTLVADRRSGFKSIPERKGKPALMIVTMKSSKSTLTKLHLGQRPKERREGRDTSIHGFHKVGEEPQQWRGGGGPAARRDPGATVLPGGVLEEAAAVEEWEESGVVGE